MKRMRVFKKMAVLIVLSVVLSAPSNVIYAFAEEYIDESESVDYEQSNLIENEESVENKTFSTGTSKRCVTAVIIR